ncbi:chemotaxis protein CheW [Acetobacterium sp.]|uniref:hybrid sensor histidine kinase/response regulator n=1 Tax=Acetobacterium sp. TaxID=1872094 RepID=UPI00271CEFA7|nr:chemotaxis protein CheW [Acetobacterium sp.]MDO9491914.1 chemotaxis protein CheW [Acetobacterium sp.]
MLKNEDFIQEFVEEAREHLENFERILLSDLADISAEQINDAFRAVHSIKGTAGFFGLVKIVAIAHSMETILDFVNRKKIAFSDAEIDLLLEAKDYLKVLVNDVKQSEAYPIDDILAKLQVTETDFSNQDAKKADAMAEQLPQKTSQFFAVFDFDQDTQAKIVSFRKFGHHIYGIEMVLNEQYLRTSGGNGAIVDNFTMVANVIEMVSPEGDPLSWDELKAGKCDNSSVRILASSILEESLLIQVLGLPPNSLHVLAEKDEQTAAAPVLVPISDNDVCDEKLIEVPLTDFNEGTESLRINIRLLDDLMDLASELVLGRNRLLTLLEPEKKQISGLPQVLQNVDRLTSRIQEKIMLTRMQPVGTLFNRYPRLIRDLSKKLDKKLELHIEGGEVELDKSILEGLSDPLVHLLRNAADHGIESAAIRKQKGKNEMATITLKASYEGSVVNIEVSDDGSGVDFTKISQIARKKKLFTENELNLMSEKELMKVLFNPGFSTADCLSEVSGRGVGMDVVRTNLEKMGGSIEMTTKSGRGTTIKLTMPLTVSIIQSLVVSSQQIKMVIPQADVQETIKIKKESLNEKIEAINGKYFYRLRDELLPVVYLYDLWNPEQLGRVEQDHKMVVLKLGHARFGLLVEALLGIEETLIKPLPVILKAAGIYSGLTILGDGKVAPILDIAGIARKMALVSDTKSEKQMLIDHHGEKSVASNDSEDFVLFRGSGNETLALNIALIKRIDKIKKTEIEQVGDRNYITRGNQPLRVIKPEDYLAINRRDDDDEYYYVITPKLVPRPIGILANEIIENVNFEPVLDAQQFKMNGIFGAAVFHEKMILIINLYALLERIEPEAFTFVPSPQATGRKILLVEDSPFFQKVEQSYLESGGYQVALAANGLEALAILETETIDAVLTDIQMPLLNGYELLKKIRQKPAYDAIPIVAISALTGALNRENGLARGFDRYEYKLDRESLLRTLDEVITESQRGEGC